MKQKFLLIGLLSFMLFFSVNNLHAQIHLTDASTLIVDFDSTFAGVNDSAFIGSGISPDPTAGMLDADAWEVFGFSNGDLSFGQTGITGDYAKGASTGGIFSGGIYSFEVSTLNRALGIQPTGSDFTPGQLKLKIVNNTGVDMDSMELSYKLYVNNDGDRGNFVKLYYSLDNVNFTNIPSADYLSTETSQGSVNWVMNQMTATIVFDPPVPESSEIIIRWSSGDSLGSGNRDEFAWDEISVKPFINPCSNTDTLLAVTACDSFMFDGMYLTNSGMYYDTIPNFSGCDSIITLDLSIIVIDTSVQVSGNTLSANAASLTYQWVDCDNAYAPISGATSQNYTPTANGNYAVIITDDICSDTSSCYSITGVGAIHDLERNISLYPNPTTGPVRIDMGYSDDFYVEIISANGSLINMYNYENQQTIELDIKGTPGLYLVKVTSGDGDYILQSVFKY